MRIITFTIHKMLYSNLKILLNLSKDTTNPNL